MLDQQVSSKMQVILGGSKQMGHLCFYFRQDERMLKTTRAEQGLKLMFASYPRCTLPSDNEW